MIVAARSPFILRRGASHSHAGYRRVRGMGVTLNCVQNPESCRNPTPAELTVDQGTAAALTMANAPPVYTCPSCAGVSIDPGVYGGNVAAYQQQLNAQSAAAQTNDENARRFATYQNAVANSIYAGTPLPPVPTYVTVQDWYSSNPGMSPGGLITTAPKGSSIPVFQGEYQGGYIPFGSSSVVNAPPPAANTQPANPPVSGPISITTGKDLPIAQSNAPSPTPVGGGAAQSNAPGPSFQNVLGVPVSSSWLSGYVFGFPTWVVLAGGLGLGALFLFKGRG